MKDKTSNNFIKNADLRLAARGGLPLLATPQVIWKFVWNVINTRKKFHFEPYYFKNGSAWSEPLNLLERKRFDFFGFFNKSSHG